MNCPNCTNDMESGFLYVRGFGASLAWSEQPDVSYVSRHGLGTIDLTKISVVPTRAQAVVAANRCRRCQTVLFNTDK